MHANHPPIKLLAPADMADAVVCLANAWHQLNGTHIAINVALNISQKKSEQT
jgi:hypothetical protein